MPYIHVVTSRRRIPVLSLVEPMEDLVLFFVSTVADFHGSDCFPAGRGISLLAKTFPLPVIASEAKQSSSRLGA